jgi:hypothetical protein
MAQITKNAPKKVISTKKVVAKKVTQKVVKVPQTKGTISININVTISPEEMMEMNLSGIIPLPVSRDNVSAISGQLTIKGGITLDIGKLAKAKAEARYKAENTKRPVMAPGSASFPGEKGFRHPNSGGNGMGMDV